MSFKLTIIGDSSVGKTSILLKYTQNRSAEASLPTIYKDYESTVSLNDQKYKLHISDTGGAEGYENIRRLSFYNVDCFILCFAINSKQSFDNIIYNWICAIKIICNECKIILVGTKSDMREKTPNSCVSRKEINELVKEIQARAYVECSAITNEGINEIFETAVKCILDD